MSINENLDKLLALNVNGMTEQKLGLTYLSWANAWKEFVKVHPDATYEIITDEKGLPYFGTAQMGYIVYTTVTTDGVTRKMWLPVMDGANMPMKDEPYQYTTKYGKVKNCDAVNMFDVNKAIMRCLTKNLAMFGLGLYIYAGEDLPEDGETPPKTNPNEATVEQMNDDSQIIGPTQAKHLMKLAEFKGVEMGKIYSSFNIKDTTQLTYDMYNKAIKRLNATKKATNES